MQRIQSMQKALDYIENNINQDLTLYDISREAGFSVPHFYRLFKRLTGDTVGAYILRRKMATAAKELTGSNKSVTKIALECGFESHDVFTRAFTRVYGMLPKDYRQSKGPPPLKRLTVVAALPSTDKRQMSFSVVEADCFYMIGMKCTARQWDSDGAIGRLWSDFLLRVDEVKATAHPMIMYGVCENEGCVGKQFSYMAAIGVDGAASIPEGMSMRLIRAQRFFQAFVPDTISTPDAYAGTIGYAKSLGFEIDEFDIIEVYEDGFHDPDVNGFRLLIPIK